MMFRTVFWDVLLCKIIVDRRFRGMCCLHLQGILNTVLEFQEMLIMKISDDVIYTVHCQFSATYTENSVLSNPYKRKLIRPTNEGRHM
jgi:hypothetical protein